MDPKVQIVSPGRGRPRKFDRDNALASLMHLFWEKGYEGATQQDMIERSGLSASSLQNTFGKKPAIFREALELYVRTQQELLAPLTAGQRGLDDLADFLSTAERHVQGTLGCPTGCLVVKTMTGPTANTEGVTELLDDARANLHGALGAALGRACQRGEIDPALLAERVEMLTASFLGIMATSGSPGGAEVSCTMIRSLRVLVDTWRPAQ